MVWQMRSCYLMSSLSRFSFHSFFSAKSSDVVFCLWESRKATEVTKNWFLCQTSSNDFTVTVDILLKLLTNYKDPLLKSFLQFSSFFLVFSKLSVNLIFYYQYRLLFLTGSWPMCACVLKLLRRPQMIPNLSSPQ